ncbi:MAG TPA: Flp pilus assembly complex ATPase component TadA [Gordonibacter urolithinfaciens]|uniref:GspE/PulE family protein n=1 Tax=Gordonibacter TaxID=644652 RepID=UPI001D201596|nr:MULTISPECIES: type II/IV secretion system protein [Gordonibacter]MDN4468966.1 Flp pilus assembly complex ATPase component TadA [Gordonibacter sp. RACS_AR68]MDN4508701.1 Flp pilus assembly complex ATPase component TadA [Gordonibacter sp. RACS_AR49]MEE0145526.1 ATPase, T2SS/T4P/T4SS family [Senegalimassilia anaerobia]HJF64017.1 Flp pilus assembly complex ATPase component TadA [Gordonibacter urolithinfaciens]
MAYKRLGDVLTDAGLITDEQLGHALAQQKESKRRLGDELIAEGVITEAELIEALQMQLGIEFVDLSAIDLDPEMSRVVSKNVARQYNVVPVRTTPEDVYLAMSDPLNFMAIEAVKNATRKRVVPMVATNDSVMRAIMTLYGNEGAARAIEEMKRDARAAGTDDGGSFQTSTLGDDADAQSAPTVRLVNSIIERAATERASDIHLEPREADLHVRMRIDGVLRTILTVPKELQASVISRLKIMGGMNTSERRVPQDGRANIRLKKQDIDLRINTLPTIHGETVVIRLLDKNESLFDPKGIGLAGSNLEKYNRLIHANNGMVLIVGPTGSGKSSTMYTMIRELNDDSVNLVTLEDPVEYNIDGANQVQINEKTGMTFASGLRAILRQDPDIVAVGEIRDGETAEIAMRAAITGHLVLSTVHTFDAASTIDRLVDIGVEPYLIASGVRGIISQRLVRLVCPHCREEYAPDPEELDALGMRYDPAVKFFRGTGCPMCFGTGYRGRTGVFEILVLDRALRARITGGATREELQTAIEQSGSYRTMADSCRELVLNGVTTVEEARKTITALE